MLAIDVATGGRADFKSNLRNDGRSWRTKHQDEKRLKKRIPRLDKIPLDLVFFCFFLRTIVENVPILR